METQLGGPMVEEYPGKTLLVVPGGSDLREKVSGTTCFLPATWTGTNLYLSVLTFNANRRGLVMLSMAAGP